MIDNEKLQKQLEAEQNAPETESLAASLLSSLSLAIYNLYRQYGTEDGLNMSRGNRKKNFFKVVTDIVGDHYKRVKQLVSSKLMGAFASTYEKYMSAYEKELDLPLVKNLPEKVVQENAKKGFPLIKTISYNRKLTLKQLRKQFLQSFRKGETQEELTKRVDDTVQKDTGRVKRIITEESARMQEQAKLQTVDDADKQGVSVEIFWRSMRDRKVRDAHQRLNGQKADKDGWFYVDGEKAKGPHLFPSIRLNISCRCYLSAIGPKVKDDKVWQELNSAASSSERRRIWEERVKASKAKQAASSKTKTAAKPVATPPVAETPSVFGSIDKKSVSVVKQSVSKLQKKYPADFEFIGSMDELEKLSGQDLNEYKKDTFGFATTAGENDDKALIAFRSDIGKADVKKSIERNMEKGRFVPVLDADYREYITTHEYGHVVDNALQAKGINFKDSGIADQFDTEATAYVEAKRKVEAPARTLPQEDRKRINKERAAEEKQLRQEFYSRELSAYGASSYEEFFAEAFAEYQLAKKPRRFARLVGEYVDKNYKGVE